MQARRISIQKMEVNAMNAVKTAILLAHAFVGWALCGATMGIGMAITTLNNALIVHAIAAPIFFACISLVYFRYFNYTSPFRTPWFFSRL